jgi:dTDP-4-dehydrorhamnose reductase
MKRILIFGAGGMTGCELAERSPRWQLDVVALERSHADITEPRAVEKAVLQAKPHIVVNAAAYTAVDRAESEADLAMSVNADGAENVARAAANHDACVVHVSTDYVFDGTASAPYHIDHPVNPAGAYARSKLAGEEAVRLANPRHAIVRTSWVFSHRGRNFVRTMLDRASTGPLRVVNDQFGRPTAAADLADALLMAGTKIEQDDRLSGTWHFANSGVTSWYDFARTIFELKGLAPQLEPIATSEYPTAARRPKYSVLDTTEFEATFGVHPRPWRDALRETLERMN